MIHWFMSYVGKTLKKHIEEYPNWVYSSYRVALTNGKPQLSSDYEELIAFRIEEFFFDFGCWIKTDKIELSLIDKYVLSKMLKKNIKLLTKNRVENLVKNIILETPKDSV